MSQIVKGKVMKRIYFGVIPVILIMAAIAVFPLTGCKTITAVITAASTETKTTSQPETTTETTAAQETTAVSVATSASIETTETVQPVSTAEKITKIGAEMTGIIPSFMCTNKTNIVKVTVKNTSDFTWRADIPNLVRFGYHFYGQDVDFTEYDNTIRTELLQDIRPGETATVNVEINDVLNKGIYVIQIDMVLEGNEDVANNFWFSSKGVTMIEGSSYFDNCQ